MATEGLACVIARCARMVNESAESNAYLFNLLARVYCAADIEIILPTIRDFCTLCARCSFPQHESEELAQFALYIEEARDPFLARICALLRASPMAIETRDREKSEEEFAEFLSSRLSSLKLR